MCTWTWVVKVKVHPSAVPIFELIAVVESVTVPQLVAQG